MSFPGLGNWHKFAINLSKQKKMYISRGITDSQWSRRLLPRHFQRHHWNREVGQNKINSRFLGEVTARNCFGEETKEIWSPASPLVFNHIWYWVITNHPLLPKSLEKDVHTKKPFEDVKDPDTLMCLVTTSVAGKSETYGQKKLVSDCVPLQMIVLPHDDDFLVRHIVPCRRLLGWSRQQCLWRLCSQMRSL